MPQVGATGLKAVFHLIAGKLNPERIYGVNTATDPQAAIAAHSRAWEAYCARIADLEAAKTAHSHAYNIHAPGSAEERDAEHRVTSAKAGVSAARGTLRTAVVALLNLVQVIARELNTLQEECEGTAKALWEKHAVGAKLYSLKLREADYHASPWRLALPVFINHVSFTDRIEDLQDIGPHFANDVKHTWQRLVQMRAIAKALPSIKP